jgi:hypothetical protein
MSSTIASNGRVSAAGRAIKTASFPRQLEGKSALLVASRRRRLILLRSTALPTLRVTVKPTRKLSSGSPTRSRNCNTKARSCERAPFLALRKSARFVNRITVICGSGREFFTSMGTAFGNHVATAWSGHAGAETVATLAH